MIEKITEYKAKMVLEKVDLAKLVSETVTLDRHLRAPCPLHKGNGNSFALWPREEPSVWTCHSQCGSGNAIQFVMKRDNLSNEQAIEWLFDKHLNLTMPIQRPNAVKSAPIGNYSHRLADFCQWAHGNLMGNSTGMATIQQWGWTADLVQQWQIGYNPKPLTIPGANFGYPEPIYLSQGLTFPHQRSGETLWVNIRRLGAQMPKYMGIKGGRRGLFGVDQWQNGADTLIITEGEKDCISGHFIAGDLYHWGAMGGASAKPDAWDSLYLAKHKRIISLYDGDKAGLKGAESLGFETLRLANGDLTDYLAAHGRLATRQMIQKLVGGHENANHFVSVNKMVACNHPTVDFWKDDMVRCLVCGAKESEWTDDRLERYYADIRATVYPSDKVGKVMAAPVKAEQVELFHQPPVTNYEYA